MNTDIIGKTFSRPKAFDINAYLFLATGAILFLLAMTLGNAMLFLPQAVLMLVAAGIFLSTKNIPMFLFADKHIEYKGAPLAAKQFFRYDKISDIAIDDKLVTFSFTNRKPFKIKLKFVRKEEKDDFILTLNTLSTEIKQ